MLQFIGQPGIPMETAVRVGASWRSVRRMVHSSSLRLAGNPLPRLCGAPHVTTRPHKHAGP